MPNSEVRNFIGPLRRTGDTDVPRTVSTVSGAPDNSLEPDEAAVSSAEIIETLVQCLVEMRVGLRALEIDHDAESGCRVLDAMRVQIESTLTSLDIQRKQRTDLHSWWSMSPDEADTPPRNALRREFLTKTEPFAPCRTVQS